jgi:hypothetical protein
MPSMVQPQPHLPSEQIRPAWRAAVLAYRRNFRETRHPSPAYEAAFAAFREVLPNIPEEEAWNHVMHAIAYAASYHSKWFWGGIYGRR